MFVEIYNELKKGNLFQIKLLLERLGIAKKISESLLKSRRPSEDFCLLEQERQLNRLLSELRRLENLPILKNRWEILKG